MRRLLIVLGTLPALVIGAPAEAQEVDAGIDSWETETGTFDDLSNLGLILPGWSVVSPANGLIDLEGVPLGDSDCCPGEYLGEVDTMVERLEDTVGLESGPDEVPLQICALHLRSVANFDVDSSGVGETWQLDVTAEGTQPVGQMTITRSDATGGTFVTDELRVIPHLTFTQIGGAGTVREVDGPEINFSGSGPVDWFYDTPAGVLNILNCHSNFHSCGTTSEDALLASHGIRDPNCTCEVQLLDVIQLSPTMHKWIFAGLTDCDISNDFHMTILQPQDVAIIGCSVDPFSSWFCDVTAPNHVSWMTATNPIPPNEKLPVFDVVIEKMPGGHDIAQVQFTRDGVVRCDTTFVVPNPISVEAKTWAEIKVRYRTSER
jgi:hypothetical protein